ncbi:MAG: GNAT family N-acetyltransferase [Pontixanthobacter sp.]
MASVIVDDVDRIMMIMECAFDPAWGEAWNRRQISDSMTMPNIYHRVFEAEGRPAGFTLVRSAPGEEELLLIAVAPEFRKAGLARRMLGEVIVDARRRGAEQLFLEMRANNTAIALYQNIGFEPIGRRADYYWTPEGKAIDAITFCLKL